TLGKPATKPEKSRAAPCRRAFRTPARPVQPGRMVACSGEPGREGESLAASREAVQPPGTAGFPGQTPLSCDLEVGEIRSGRDFVQRRIGKFRPPLRRWGRFIYWPKSLRAENPAYSPPPGCGRVRFGQKISVQSKRSSHENACSHPGS